MTKYKNSRTKCWDRLTRAMTIILHSQPCTYAIDSQEFHDIKAMLLALADKPKKRAVNKDNLQEFVDLYNGKTKPEIENWEKVLREIMVNENPLWHNIPTVEKFIRQLLSTEDRKVGK